MKEKTVFICSKCGYESPKWLGKCPECGSWGTLEEETVAPPARKTGKQERGEIRQSPRGQRLAEVETVQTDRFSSGSGEFDRVLGGGIVPGSIVLCGGDPGIGKSTLLLQVCDFVSGEKPVLYVSAEESARQIRLRADRLGCRSENLFVLAETNIDDICAQIEAHHPYLAVIDSIQTVYADYLNPAPGTVSQVRECASRLMRVAKESGVTVFTVGHVTKEGTLAGPKVLEHIVDTVLYFEGERNDAFRVLRANKNRFGSTNEIGIFEMGEEGLRDVPNPSELFLAQRTEAVSGTAVLCSVEGSRPVMAEIQALIGNSGFGNPRRVANGVDYSRMVALLAVLEKRLGYLLYNQDVYINIAGGLKIDEPAMDLPLLAAAASSYRNIPIPADTVLLGEVGLTGELRGISQCQRRLEECRKLGFRKVVLPKGNQRSVKPLEGLDILFCENLYQALSYALDAEAPVRQGKDNG